MNKQTRSFVWTDCEEEAKFQCPWATVFSWNDRGCWCFATTQDYEEWREEQPWGFRL